MYITPNPCDNLINLSIVYPRAPAENHQGLLSAAYEGSKKFVLFGCVFPFSPTN